MGVSQNCGPPFVVYLKAGQQIWRHYVVLRNPQIEFSFGTFSGQAVVNRWLDSEWLARERSGFHVLSWIVHVDVAVC